LTIIEVNPDFFQAIRVRCSPDCMGLAPEIAQYCLIRAALPVRYAWNQQDGLEPSVPVSSAEAPSAKALCIPKTPDVASGNLSCPGTGSIPKSNYSQQANDKEPTAKRAKGSVPTVAQAPQTTEKTPSKTEKAPKKATLMTDKATPTPEKATPKASVARNSPLQRLREQAECWQLIASLPGGDVELAAARTVKQHLARAFVQQFATFRGGVCIHDGTPTVVSQYPTGRYLFELFEDGN
jgi:hypothetical protein